jgi:phenylpropionate dioxygenase-like ring-hydroxylating dioxygenase large terminal subunit
MMGHWYIACLAGELARTPLARTICGRRIVLFRGAEGRAGALADRCAHRHMALSRGCVVKDGLQCCYHGWVYAADGKCVRIPAACGDAPQLGIGVIGVKSYPVVEKQGLVWIYVSDSDEAPASSPRDFPFFGAPRWQHWFMQREFEAAAFDCCENFLDCPHTAHVHRGLFRKENAKVNEVEITCGADWVQADFLNEERMDTLMGRAFFPKGATMKHTDRFMLPFTTRVDYRVNEQRHFVVMSQCTPVSENQTRVFTYMAFRFDPLARLIRLFYEPFAHRILDQDVDMLAKQAADIAATGPRRYIFHETDAIAREMRDLVEGRSLEGREPRRKKIAF